MWIILILILVTISYLTYELYLKKYILVRNEFKLLLKTLDVRDLLILKLLPEIKNKNISNKIAYLINERVKNKKCGHLEQINLDIELNKEIKSFYEELNKNLTNEIVKTTFKKVIEIEKKLKNIRKSYNDAVNMYNDNLIKHKKICMKTLKMKPLDTYGLKYSKEGK